MDDAHRVCSRDFQFKVKGISMSVFTEEDVAYLASMGNAQFNARHLATFNARDHPPPTGSDVVKLKEFIRAKYLDKRWFRENGAGPAGGSNASPTPAAGSVPPSSSAAAPTAGNVGSLQHNGSGGGGRGFGGVGRTGSITIKPLGSKQAVSIL